MAESQPCAMCQLIGDNKLDEAIMRLNQFRISNCLNSSTDSRLIDPDSGALLRIITLYKNYLKKSCVELSTSKQIVWKDKDVVQSKVRFQVLHIVGLLLNAGIDPNVKVGSESALLSAVTTHDTSLVKCLLNNGANPNMCDFNSQMTAFALAIILNDHELVAMLISFGADINAVCCATMTPLQLSMNKCVEISKILLQNGADIHQVLNVGNVNEVLITGPPLIQAIAQKNAYLTSVLLEHGEDVNQSYGTHLDMPLHDAVKSDNAEIVRLLIDYGANLDKVNGSGRTPLGAALFWLSNEDIAEILLNAGCSRSKMSVLVIFQRDFPLLHIACFYGKFRTIRKLLHDRSTMEHSSCLKSGVGHSERNSWSESANKDMFLSSERVDNERSFSMQGNCLTSRNVDGIVPPNVDLPASDNSTALYMAALGGHLEIVHYLLEQGASPHVQCPTGTLVHAAVSSGNVPLLELVLSLGCVVNAVNDYGNTPLLLASRTRHAGICTALINNGALLNEVDKFGETALSASVYFGCEKNSQILIQHGADVLLPDSR